MKIFEMPETDDLSTESAGYLDFYQNKFGFVPNLPRVMSHSPELLGSYMHLADAFSKTSFAPVERELIPLIISVFNQCHYCIPAHTMMCSMAGVPQDAIDAVRASQAIADPKLEALRQFVLAVTEQRGKVPDASVDGFLAAGFAKNQVLEVVLGVTFKTLSNYVSHLVDQDIDEPFKKFA